MGTNIFDRVNMTLEFDLIFETFKFVNNFLTVRGRVVMFPMQIPCYNIFLLILNFLTSTFLLFLFLNLPLDIIYYK